MNDYEAKRICLVIGIVVAIWFLFTKFDIHTGGNETYTSNRTGAIAVSLVGDATVAVDNGAGGTSGGKKTITIICPHCNGEIVIEQ